MHLLSLALPLLLLGGRRIIKKKTWSYVGCFSDPADNRIFEFKASTPAMSAEMCSDLCADSAFFGTQYGNECWCGDNEEYDANGASICDMPCSGDVDLICGGYYSMSVYMSVYMNVYENPEPIYLGCYSDPPADNRLFELQTASSEDMTGGVCLGLCDGYEFFGTQYGTECWCGNNSDYDAHGAGVCNMLCSGDMSCSDDTPCSKEFCGGYYSISVYATG